MRAFPNQRTSGRTQSGAIVLLLLAATLVAITPGAHAATIGDGSRIDPTTGVAPDVTTATFQDSDGNGRYDRVVIAFAADTAGDAVDTTDDDREPLVETIRPGDFSVGSGATKLDVRGCVSTDGIVCSTAFTTVADPAGGRPTLEIALIIAESIAYQTSGLPAVSFSGAIYDHDGDVLTSDSTITEVDDAAPLVGGAYAKPGDDEIMVVLSESIVNIGAGGLPPLIPGDAALDVGDVCYVDGGGSTQVVSGFAHSSGTVTLDVEGAGGADADSLQVDDINQAIGTASVGFGDDDGGDCAVSSVADAADNPVVAAGNPPGAGARPISDLSALDGAFVDGVFTDVGATKAYVVFNGPVQAAGGGALTGAAFQYVNSLAAQGGATGILSVQHTAGSNIVQLNLQGRVLASDAGNDQINILANQVAAAGDSDNRIDDDVTENIVFGQPSEAGFAPLRHNALDVYPVSAVTVDNNRNGIVDAVLVAFSGTVTIGGAPTDWTVRELQGKDAPLEAVEEAVVASGTDVGCDGTQGANGAPLAAITNAIYVCIDEGTPFDTDTVFVVSHATAGLTDGGGTALVPFANLRAVDASRPVLLEYATLDSDSDGQIDRLRAKFSEKMDDSTFKASEWSVLAYGPDGNLGGGDDIVFTVEAAVDTTLAADVDDDATIYVKLTEKTTPDTDLVPLVRLTRNAGLLDLPGNGIASFDMTEQVADEAVEPTRLDRALPVIVTAATEQGTTTALVTFSEPVYSAFAAGPPAAPSGALDFGDFVYQDNNGAGAAGINDAEHSAGSESATLTLDAPVSSSDFSGDKITVNFNSVYDAVGNIAVQVFRAFSDLDAPTIVSIKTLDQGTGAPPVAGEADGLLDGFEVTLSEAIDDVTGGTSNLEAAEWTVKLGARTVSSTSGDGFTVTTGTTADDNKIMIAFDGDLDLDITVSPDGWSTDALPTLTYQPDSVGGFLRALDDGAPVAPVNDRPAADGAAPVLLQLSGSVGANSAQVTFSEAVQGSGVGDALRQQDFTFVEVPNANSQATAIAGVSHTSGSKSATLTFNQPLSQFDFDNDKVAARTTVDDAAGNQANVAIERTFADASAPVLQKVETVDNDQNGRLDHLRLVFSEPIDDGGDGTDCTNIAHLGLGNPWTVKLGATTLMPTAIVTDIGVATCAVMGDNTIFMQFAESATLHGGVRPTVSYDANAANALVEDQAATANKLATIGSFMAADKIKPLLVTQAGVPGQPEAGTQDLDGDGLIDAYRLVFSEPVLDSTYRLQEWLVGPAATDSAPHSLGALNSGTVANDATIFLPFTEGNNFDTEETPQLTYTKILGLTDPAGNSLETLGPGAPGAAPNYGAIAEVDKALPTLVKLATGAGLTIAQVEFSEPIGGVAGNPPTDDLSVADFDYVNGNSAGAGGLTNVAVAANTETGTVTFDATVTVDDVANDALGAQPLAIFDAAGNGAAFAPVSLSGNVADTTAPAAITDLTVMAGIEELTLTWTTPTATDLASFDIRISETDIQSESAFQGAPKINAGTIGDAAAPPTPISGQAQTVTITGLDAAKTYFFAMKTADTTGNPSARSNTDSASPDEVDNTPPAAITDLAEVSTNANSITVDWTPVGDDGSTGTVTSYTVKVATSAITSEALFDSAPSATATFNPSSLLAGDATTKQQATITQIGGAALSAGTTYHIAIRGVDDANNEGGFDTVQATTGTPDDTPPTGSLTVTSSTHQPSVATENDDPTFSWSGLTDAESTITYYFVLNKETSFTVTDAVSGVRSGSTPELTTSFTDVPAGDWTFHVAGVSQGGTSDTASYSIVIETTDVPAITDEVIEAANEDLRDSLEVERDGDDNILTWTIPSGLPQDPAGVQIWKSESPFVELVDLASTSAAYQAARFVDEGASATATYLMTLYFVDDPLGGQVTDLKSAPGYQGLSDEELDALAIEPAQEEGGDEDDGFPVWGWILIVLGVILVGLLVFFLIKASRKGGDEAEAWDDDTWDDEEGAAWTAGATDGGVDAWDNEMDQADVECPRCDHPFTVAGERPIHTQCPNCGVKGVLR